MLDEVVAVVVRIGVVLVDDNKAMDVVAGRLVVDNLRNVVLLSAADDADKVRLPPVVVLADNPVLAGLEVYAAA